MTSNTNEPRGTIYYDGECGLCSTGARRMEHMLRRRGFTLEPLQSAIASEALGFPSGQIPDEVKLRLDDGRVLGGAEAAMEVARYVWWMRPMRIVQYIPGGMSLARSVYRRIARHRHGISKACALSADDDSLFCRRISLITETTVRIGHYEHRNQRP